jgi:hypothetical protein
MKGIQIGNEKANLSLFANDTILYLKLPKKLHQQTPRHHKHHQQNSRIQNQFIKISSFSICQQCRKIIPFTVASKNKMSRNKHNEGSERSLKMKTVSH